jgi:hypothetical protein
MNAQVVHCLTMQSLVLSLPFQLSPSEVMSK